MTELKPRTIKDVQSLIGNIIALNRFIPRVSEQIRENSNRKFQYKSLGKSDLIIPLGETVMGKITAARDEGHDDRGSGARKSKQMASRVEKPKAQCASKHYPREGEKLRGP